MKSFITPAYTFTPGTSGVGTLNLSGIAAFDVKKLVAVINQTTGQMVYSTASPLYKYTNVAGTTLTLFADTSAMLNTDVLQVIYEDPSAIPVSAAALPLPTGAATSAKQDLLLAELQLKADLSETQPVSLASVPLPTGAATSANQVLLLAELTNKSNKTDTQPVSASSLPLPTGAATETKQDNTIVVIGAVNETAPASDTASSGLNGRLQRIAQRLTSLIALLPSSIGQKANAASLGVALSTEQEAILGAVNETAPASDTASSGHNGRLQRIAQRLTSLIALLPSSIGTKTAANSFAVVPASDYIPPAAAVPGTVTPKQAFVAFGTSAVRLTTDNAAPSVTRRKLQFIIEPSATPTGTEAYYVGSSTVTSSGATRGIIVYPGTLYTYDNDANDLYIISNTASQNVGIFEEE